MEARPTLPLTPGARSDPLRSSRSTANEALLTPEQVAAWLQVRVELLYKWRYSRCGPPGLKIGRYLRYRVVDVAAWIEEQSRKSA
jgi:Helix-turn-helix domain